MKSAILRTAKTGRIFIALSLTVSWVLLAAANGRASEFSRVFDVRQFGAAGDGRTLDTKAIQRALDACGNNGGGIVHFPAGMYLSKPLFLRSRMTIQLDNGAILKATDRREDFINPDKTNSYIAFMNGRGLHDITVTGSGIIDGAGARWWGPAETARRKTPGYVLPRPNMMALFDCTNVCVDNVTLQNSPLTHLALIACDNCVVSNVIVRTPAGTPNTDAIDPINCRNVLITRCRINAGDDNISIKSERPVPGRAFASENVTVTDCVFLHGHGMSIGAAVVGGVRNVTVRDCTFQDTENGIRIKSVRGRGGVVENVRFSNIQMTHVNPAITFTCYYMTNSAGDPVPRFPPEQDAAHPISETTPVFRDISVSNLTATCTESAGIIIGLPESLISNVDLEDVNLRAASGLTIRNARDIRLKNVTVSSQEGPPYLLENAEVKGLKTAD